MTEAEVTQIFAALSLAYPSAELFKAPSQRALEEKLAPTIALWATCLRDVDFWTGQMATVRLCQTCKYPPSIAELREAAEAVTKEVREEIFSAYMTARSLYQLHGKDGVHDVLPDRVRKVIDAMGGIEAFASPGSNTFAMDKFQSTYEMLLRKNPVGLPVSAGGTRTLK